MIYTMWSNSIKIEVLIISQTLIIKIQIKICEQLSILFNKEIKSCLDYRLDFIRPRQW